jgi:hypothetical protein
MGLGPTVSESAAGNAGYTTEFANTFGQATQAYANSMSNIAQATETWSQQMSQTLERERATHRHEVAELAGKLDDTKLTLDDPKLTLDNTKLTLDKTKTERDEAFAALMQADTAFHDQGIPTVAGDPFAVHHVTQLRKAFQECRALRGEPDATQPQGSVDPGMLFLAEMGGCFLAIRPTQIKGGKSTLDWKRFRHGLHDQLVRMQQHLDQMNEASYRERPAIPDLAEFICCLMTPEDQMRIPLPKPDNGRPNGSPP